MTARYAKTDRKYAIDENPGNKKCMQKASKLIEKKTENKKIEQSINHKETLLKGLKTKKIYIQWQFRNWEAEIYKNIF